MENPKCEECNKEFNSEEALNMHNKSKHYERYKEPKKKITDKRKKKIRNWFIFIIILIAVIGGITFLMLNIKTLPPTSMDGHVEKNPPLNFFPNAEKVKQLQQRK